MGLVEFLRDVSKSLGRDVVVPRDEWVGFRRDWWPLLMLLEIQGEPPREPPAVLRPGSVDDVVTIVRLARTHGVSLVPYGGGSSVVGGSYHDGSVILDLSRLNKVLEFNEEDLIIRVEAGARLSELESWLNSRGYTLDYHPQSFYLATIGGAIAHRGTGSHSASNIENIVLSMDVVLPDGRLVRIGPGTSVRTSMGPDLRYLFMGSEGTLGIIVSAMLRIQPLASAALDAAYSFDNVKRALAFLRDFSVKLPPPHRVVVHDEESSAYMLGEPRVIALIRFRRHDESLVKAEAALVDSIARVHGASPIDSSLVRKWRWVFARGYDKQFLDLVNSGLWMDTIDAAATWSRLARIHGEVSEALRSIDGVVGILSRFTHPYINGASMYSVVIFRRDRELYWRIWSEAARIIIGNGGTVSHHHGVGLLKRKWLTAERNDVDLLLSLKRVIDDAGIMNPGKLLGP